MPVLLAKASLDTHTIIKLTQGKYKTLRQFSNKTPCAKFPEYTVPLTNMFSTQNNKDKIQVQKERGFEEVVHLFLLYLFPSPLQAENS